VFKHKGGMYLFDPFTRTCASINEEMLAFATNSEVSNSYDNVSSSSRKGLMKITKQLRKLDILIEQGATVKDGECTPPDGVGSDMYLAIFVTEKCNLRCAYCYANGGDSGKTISRDIWRLAMDYYFSTLLNSNTLKRGKHKSVDLSIHGGGEPTVEFDTVKEIVAGFSERAHAVGLQPSIGMGSNGTYGEDVQRWIIENNIDVNISLDGPQYIQNHLRPFRSGRPSYDRVANNIKGLVKAGRSVSVRATVTDEVLGAMEQTIELANQLGIASVHFEPVTLTGRCANTGVARPDEEQFAEKFLKCFLLGLKHNIEVTYSGMCCFQSPRKRFCAACGEHFCVTPNGDITTCYEVLYSSDPASSAFFIGKIDPVQSRVMLDHVRMKKLKQRVAENIEACKNCFLRWQCAGDCPVKSFKYSNRDLYSPDPYRCRIADRINKQLIVWLADGNIKPRDDKKAQVFSLNKNVY
jgi:uncharacterized protein